MSEKIRHSITIDMSLTWCLQPYDKQFIHHDHNVFIQNFENFVLIFSFDLYVNLDAVWYQYVICVQMIYKLGSNLVSVYYLHT